MIRAPRKKPMGRPPGTAEHEQLVHVRLPDDLKDGLDVLRDRLASQDPAPTVSSLIRRAVRKLLNEEGVL